MRLTVNSDMALLEALTAIKHAYAKDRYIEVEVNAGKRRTVTQNRALHLWLSMLADALNDAGYDQRKVLASMREGVELPWSGATCKENLWRPIQEAMTGKRSTTECKTVEYSEVQEVLVRHLADKFGFTAPEWPSLETITNNGG